MCPSVLFFSFCLFLVAGRRCVLSGRRENRIVGTAATLPHRQLLIENSRYTTSQVAAQRTQHLLRSHHCEVIGMWYGYDNVCTAVLYQSLLLFRFVDIVFNGYVIAVVVRIYVVNIHSTANSIIQTMVVAWRVVFILIPPALDHLKNSIAAILFPTSRIWNFSSPRLLFNAAVDIIYGGP